MKSVTFTQILLWLAYPLIIFFGIQYLQPRYVALLLAMLLIIRWRNEAKSLLSGMSQIYVVVFTTLLLVVVLTTITNNETLLRLYPALVNAGMLFIFGYSLKSPPSIIERFARLHEPALNAAGVRYTRKVTQVWCGFFVLNGCVAIFTALCASRAVWSLYNGLIAYILMGIMFAGEWLIRRRIILKNTKSG
jgi:uncharacterized membrane protein